MHEMSIAMNILEIAEQNAIDSGSSVINSIEVEIGTLAGIELSSLSFCFETARKSTRLAQSAKLEIISIAAVGKCADCNVDAEADFYHALCPECGQPVAVSGGRDLRVKSINVD